MSKWVKYPLLDITSLPQKAFINFEHLEGLILQPLGKDDFCAVYVEPKYLYHGSKTATGSSKALTKKSDFWGGDGDFQDIHGVGFEEEFRITPQASSSTEDAINHLSSKRRMSNTEDEGTSVLLYAESEDGNGGLNLVLQ
ncbi:hypothetical protein Tco_1289992, partial [Tanacetum coccineum]